VQFRRVVRSGIYPSGNFAQGYLLVSSIFEEAHMFRRLLLTPTAAVVIALVAPGTSRADFDVTLQVATGTNTYDTATFDVSASGQVTVSGNYNPNNLHYNPGTFSVSPGSGNTTNLVIVGLSLDGYSIVATSAASNQPGTLTQASLDTSGFGVTNTNVNQKAFGGQNSVTLTISDGPYQNPLGPTTMVSNLTGSIGQGNSGIVLSGGATYKDSNGNVVGSATPASYTLTSNSPGTNGYSNVINSTNGFTLTNSITVSGLTTGELNNIALSTTLSTPAPSGLILAATMVPFFGLLRRRLRGMVTPISV